MKCFETSRFQSRKKVEVEFVVVANSFRNTIQSSVYRVFKKLSAQGGKESIYRIVQPRYKVIIEAQEYRRILSRQLNN